MKFYVLEDPDLVRDPGLKQSDAITDFSPLKPETLGEAPRCAACGKFTGMLPILPPIRVELELWGRRFGDIVFGPGNERLVTQRFRDAFLQAGLTGLSSFVPV